MTLTVTNPLPGGRPFTPPNLFVIGQGLLQDMLFRKEPVIPFSQVSRILADFDDAAGVHWHIIFRRRQRFTGLQLQRIRGSWMLGNVYVLNRKEGA